MRTSILFCGALCALAIGMGSCSADGSGDFTPNIFSLEDDINFGRQADSAIMANPAEYPVLNRAQFPASYAYIEKIRNKILNSGQVFYKDKFAWEIKIIRDDNTLNAFCTPGGYIYVYTGLIKFLDHESELAGVLGHEMAHADRRHSTDQLTQQLGLSTLLDIVLGKNQGALSNIGQTLLSLSFSRNQESEADDYSVMYLCPTDYSANGAAGFFDKLISQGSSGGTPTFLSTHPGPEDRVTKINSKRNDLGCTGSNNYDADYSNFKAGLPN
ncbi:MAG TPA: M48 family metalloprotease [Luteibaculaceae bacterium]|nr:M48 family metalloprotease [Luteibaculaceae bacterium]